MIVKENKASLKIAKSLGLRIQKIFKNFIIKKEKDMITFIFKNNWKNKYT